MKNKKQIITSLLDIDFYKFSMAQVVLHNFPGAMVKYEFKCRTPNINLSQHINRIREEIDKLSYLSFKNDELEYLKGLGFFKPDFIEYLKIFKLNPKLVSVTPSPYSAEINIELDGPWISLIFFETLILSIVNEIYFEKFKTEELANEAKRRLRNKINLVKEVPSQCKDLFKFADFGTRRRFSKNLQESVIKILNKELPNNFVGTSNVYFARKYGIKPIGTMAHEFLMAAQSLGPKLVNSQKFALQTWADEYRGDLGIALSDVVGMDAFLNDFDKYFSKLFDGARHDSGHPFKWADKLIKHYENLGIDPRTKTAVFSDGLTIEKAIMIFKRFYDKIQVSFGIGTNLTNDTSIDPIQVVIKMTHCNGEPVAKISDSPGKQMCKDESYLSYLKKVYNIKDRG